MALKVVLLKSVVKLLICVHMHDVMTNEKDS